MRKLVLSTKKISSQYPKRSLRTIRFNVTGGNQSIFARGNGTVLFAIWAITKQTLMNNRRFIPVEEIQSFPKGSLRRSNEIILNQVAGITSDELVVGC